MKFLNNNSLTIAVLLLIIIAFITLQPTSASTLQLNNREAKWNTFVKHIDGSRMDTKLFWQTREFYSPGSFVYNKNGLPAVNQEYLLREAGMGSPRIKGQLLVLEYTAPHYRSFESLIPNEIATEVLKQISVLSAQPNMISKGENFVLVKSKKNKTILIFLATYDEMKKANGFFKYEEDDKDLVKGKSWLNVSEIVVD